MFRVTYLEIRFGHYLSPHGNYGSPYGRYRSFLVTLVSEFSCLSLLLSVTIDSTLPTLLSTLSLTPLYSLFTHTSLPTPYTRKRSHLRSHAARANSWETPADSIDLPSFPSVNLVINSILLPFYSYFSSFSLYKKQESPTHIPCKG